MVVGNHSAQLLPYMSGHNVRTKAAVVGHLGNMHGKCPMSDRYFKLQIMLQIMLLSTIPVTATMLAQ